MIKGLKLSNNFISTDLRKTSTYISIQILYTVLAILLMTYHATQHYNISGKSLFFNFFLFGEVGEDMLFILMGFAVFYTSYHFIEEQSGYKCNILAYYCYSWSNCMVFLS